MAQLDRGRLAKYHGMEVTLTLSIPGASEGDDNGDDAAACVSVSAPDALLADLNAGGSPPENCSMGSGGDGHLLSFSVHTPDHLPHDWCSNGTHLRLSYKETPDWVVQLSTADRELVARHLLCTSAFLFVLVVMILVYALFRIWTARGGGRGGASSSALSPTTAPNSTKTSGDGRGDLQLLPQDIE